MVRDRSSAVAAHDRQTMDGGPQSCAEQPCLPSPSSCLGHGLTARLGVTRQLLEAAWLHGTVSLFYRAHLWPGLQQGRLGALFTGNFQPLALDACPVSGA